MLGSLNSSSHDQEEDETSDLHNQQVPHAPSPLRASTFSSSSLHMRQLLISCAELISQSDFSAARSLVSILSASSSPYGDSMERLVHQFVKALCLRLNLHSHSQSQSQSHSLSCMLINTNNIPTPPPPLPSAIGTSSAGIGSGNYMMTNYNSNIASSSESLHSCYLSLNQITPFIRFSHLTANQAILEAIQVGQQAIHIIDFDIMHGVQWPPLMQALADRSNSTFHPPPMLRITGTGHDLSILHRTGDRLLKFAQSLGLRFQFHPLVLVNNSPNYLALNLPSSITLLPDEALAVNCVLYLHRLLKDDSRELILFLHKIKALNPKIVTVAEREANHNHPLFLHRFVEAIDHYAALFESLEATLPPNSRERLEVEQIWFGREIMDIVAADGDNRRERHERFESWEMILRSTGFTNVPLSPFALSQAKLLLRLHYPSEGYHLQILNNTFFLGWQNRALFSVSSWH